MFTDIFYISLKSLSKILQWIRDMRCEWLDSQSLNEKLMSTWLDIGVCCPVSPLFATSACPQWVWHSPVYLLDSSAWSRITEDILPRADYWISPWRRGLGGFAGWCGDGYRWNSVKYLSRSGEGKRILDGTQKTWTAADLTFNRGQMERSFFGWKSTYMLW